MQRILAILLLLPLFANAQVITTIAGNDSRGKTGNGGPATNAQLNQPIAITVDDSGNVYIIDAGNDDIRKVSPNGIITIFASSKSSKPHGIFAGTEGKVYYTENLTNVVRVTAADGTRATIAGIRGTSGYSFFGDKSATNATLYGPNGITIDKQGNLYFADGGNNRIRCISKDGTINTIAGTGTPGYSGNGGKASRAQINMPWGLAADENGNIYFTDMANNVIRKIDADGIISTIAGNGRKGYDGDKGAATNASLNEPRGLAIDHSGNIFFADSRNDAVRMINKLGIINTYAGNGQRLFHIGDTGINVVAYIPDDGHHGDGGPATKAQLYWPYDVALDADGNLYIADADNHVVRKVSVSKKEQPKSGITKLSVPRVDVRKTEILKIKINTTEPTKVEIPKMELTKLNMPKTEVEKITFLQPKLAKVAFSHQELPNIPIPEIVLPRTEIPREDISNAITLKVKTLKTEIAGNDLPVLKVPTVELPRPEIPHDNIPTAATIKIKTFKTETAGNELPEFKVPMIELPHPEIQREDIPTARTIKTKAFAIDITPKIQSVVQVPLIQFPRPELPREEIPKVNAIKIKPLKTEIASTGQPVFDVPSIEFPKEEIPADLKKPVDAFTVSADAENETLTITIDSGAYANIIVTDVNNKTLIQQSIKQAKTIVDISALPPAHYFINLNDGDRVKTAMFVKDK